MTRPEGDTLPRRRRRTDPSPWTDDYWDEADLAWATDVEPLRPQRRWIGRLLVVIAILVVGGLLITGAIGWWYVRQLNPPGDPGAPVNFTVNQGDTLETVSERLEEAGLVEDAGVFRWYVRREGGLQPVPGYYAIRPDDHVGNVLAVLRTPPAETFIQVTFPEGLTLRQMGERLAEKVTGLDADRFVQLATESNAIRSTLQSPYTTSLEGLLFPDTYQIAGNETEADIIERMTRLMERVGRQTGLDQSGATGGLSPYEVLIIASMIEKEAKVPEDRAKIARVIYNRLFLGMPLQIDATLYYGQDGDQPFDVLKATDTPYNTYLHTGLPPTPIANPGRASIEAALNPAPNPPPGDALCVGLPRGTPCALLYYVLADADGRHAFAVTLQQHEENIRKAREAGLL